MKHHCIFRRPLGRVSAALLLALTLGACSSTPDWANPVEWYRGTADWIGGEDKDTAAARDAAKKPENAPPNADAPFPNLASVPSRPAGAADRSKRRKNVQKALVADRANARHAALTGLGPKPEPAGIPAATPPAPPPAAPMAAAEVPPRPVPVKPDPSVYPPEGSNPAFQAAIAQQRAGTLAPRPPAGPVRRNTIGVPPPSRGGVVLNPPAPKAAPVPAAPLPRPVAPVHAGDGRPLATVLFANNSSRISRRYNNELQIVVDRQRQLGGTIKVVGHASSRTRNTDPLAHRIANFRISMARARAVAQRLVRLGAPANKIEVSAVSDSQPVYQEIMPLGEAGNRRAEIYLEN
ncbi:MAG: OmpA family protein [Alphaproteobacteria bacterium]|nr:OmpA family protein [Alphaproteobacteria bacterium]